jgi:hypothetical protein
MRTRRRVALAAFGFLVLVLIVVANRPGELARRARLLAHDAGREPAARRLDGSSAAFDRRYFLFLESVRRHLPPGARGVAVRLPSGGEAHRNLAAYHLAPLPVILEPHDVPEDWVLAVYGAARPEGWREISRFPDGALFSRAP